MQKNYSLELFSKDTALFWHRCKYLRTFEYTRYRAGSHLREERFQEVRTLAIFWYSPVCDLKFLNQFRRNAFKNQFKKRKNPQSKSVFNICFYSFCKSYSFTIFRNSSWILAFLPLTLGYCKNINRTCLKSIQFFITKFYKGYSQTEIIIFFIPSYKSSKRKSRKHNYHVFIAQKQLL